MSALAFSRSQRWRERRAKFVPDAGTFDPACFSVDVISCAREAKPFVIEHHYSGSFPATRLSCGLFRNGPGGRAELVGVAAFAVPMNNAAIPKHTGLEDAAAGVDLGRLVLLDDVEGNAESWFVARAFRLLRCEKRTVQSVIAYSDPLRRVSRDGTVTMPGHVGMVYQALSATCRGRSAARTNLLLPDGRVLSPRALSKIRRMDRGWIYAARQIIDAGLSPRAAGEAPADWLARLVEAGELRRSRHPGNLVYTFHLTRAAKLAARKLPSLPYPGPEVVVAA
ncbi:Mom family adenine methylcarbamoylation protein [Halovulum marinum]|uniref:Mom family adenine methylcarbamoylation protein n=1 Tax=Halovulum marinum TaxID=2662447 RepID=UPI001F32D4FE|nr:hypothetical protein [Halovulum marinum]